MNYLSLRRVSRELLQIVDIDLAKSLLVRRVQKDLWHNLTVVSIPWHGTKFLMN